MIKMSGKAMDNKILIIVVMAIIVIPVIYAGLFLKPCGTHMEISINSR